MLVNLAPSPAAMRRVGTQAVTERHAKAIQVEDVPRGGVYRALRLSPDMLVSPNNA